MYNIENIKNTIINGDCLEELKKIPNECVDMIITSPPYYGLRKYGDYKQQIGLEKTFEEYLKKILEITAELKRVLKPTGQFWLNLGDCYGGVKEGKTDKKVSDYVKKSQVGLKKNIPEMEKCLMMMPERIAMAMIDHQGFILRNKIKWAKQILLYKEKITKGSVMPTSVKDRFNESGEDLYFFVKNKKYYSNLDAVRLPNQVLGVTDFRASGLVRSAELYPNSKYAKAEGQGKIDGRVSKHIKARASEEEINKYNKGSEYEQKYGEPWDRFGQKTLKVRMDDTKNKDTKSSRTANIKKLLSEVRLGVKPNTGMVSKQSELRGKFDPRPKTGAGSLGYGKEVMDYYKDSDIKGNINGKNLPTVHLVEEERNDFIPFSFEKQIAVLGVKEFENLKNIFGIVENQLINSSAGMQSGADIPTDNNSQSISDIIQEFFSSRKIQPYLTLFRGNPYAAIAIKNTTNEISVIFGRNVWIFRNETFTGDDTSFSERDYKWFAFNCNPIIGQILPLFNWMSGFQLGTDYLKQLNVFRSKFKLRSTLGNVAIGYKESQEISGGSSNFAKVFLVESILAMTVIISRTIPSKSFVVHKTKSSGIVLSAADRTELSNSDESSKVIPHIISLTDFLEKGNGFPTVWLIGSEPHNFQKEFQSSVDHFAIFPQALCEIPIKFGCPENGIVLDPFSGSGTVAIVAKKLGRNYIGIELNKDYISIAEKRLAIIPPNLFAKNG